MKLFLSQLTVTFLLSPEIRVYSTNLSVFIHTQISLLAGLCWRCPCIYQFPFPAPAGCCGISRAEVLSIIATAPFTAARILCGLVYME